MKAEEGKEVHPRREALYAGVLNPNSELRDIFGNGLVPLKTIVPEVAKGRQGETVKLYLVDWESLMDSQKAKVIEKFRVMGIPADEESVRKEGYRIQAKHFSSVSAPLRMFV